jgi:hypothetical protein
MAALLDGRFGGGKGRAAPAAWPFCRNGPAGLHAPARRTKFQAAFGRFAMRRNIVVPVWLVGIALTVAVYQIGPDRIVWTAFESLHRLRESLDEAFAALALNIFDLMRALAIGLFPVFVVLSLMALRRGLPARGALAAVTLVFLLLLAAPLRRGEVISDTRWTGAFLLVLVGSIAMTRRLTALPGPISRGPSSRGPAGSPWPSR